MHEGGGLYPPPPTAYIESGIKPTSTFLIFSKKKLKNLIFFSGESAKVGKSQSYVFIADFVSIYIYLGSILPQHD